MSLTRYTQPLPDYEPSYIRYTRPNLETLHILRCMRKPYATRTLEVIHNLDATRLQNAFNGALALHLFLWSVYEAQSKLCDLVYDTPVAAVTEFGHPISHGRDIRYLIHEKYLHAERATTHGRPYLVASKSITNLLRLIDAGPLPRLTKEPLE